MLKTVNTRMRIIATFTLSLILCLMLIPFGAYAHAEPIETIAFDLSRGTVEIGVISGDMYIYQGYDSEGTLITGEHIDSNTYFVSQTDSATVTSNRIILYGNSDVPEYDVTISNINCANAQNKGIGGICATALSSTPMRVTLRLDGVNSVGRVHYATGPTATNSISSLLITSAAGDGSTTGTLTAYSSVAWSAAIGGVDTVEQESARNITIAGGTIYAEVAAGTNPALGTSAIGGGGNGTSDVTITGGIITAKNSGTGATIGGGGGQSDIGAQGIIVIEGGVVNATNSYALGVAIGAGGSLDSNANGTSVTIRGGIVTTTGSIGGGSSQSRNGGNATVTISGGVVNVNGNLGISGGNSDSGVAGTVTVAISGGTVTAHTISGGTVASSGTTAAGTLSVTGGSVHIAEVPTTTTSTNGSEELVLQIIQVPDISAVTLVTGVSITREDDTQYDYGSAMYTDTEGKLYLWLPSDCVVDNNSIITVAPTFTITIPETVSISGSNGSFNLQGERSGHLPMASWTVTLSAPSGFELVGAGQSLTYELHSQASSGPTIASGAVVATYVGNGTNTTTIYYSILDTPLYSGTYTDTLTFTVSVDDGQ